MQAVLFILTIIKYAIFGTVVMSWFPAARESKFASVLRLITEPILFPIRELINKISGGRFGMLDFSPFFALVIIMFLEGILRGL
jgi:YggT family protein